MREAVDTITATGHVADQARRLLFAAETYALAHDEVNARLCVGEALALAAKAGEVLPHDLLGRVQAAVDACGVRGSFAGSELPIS